MLHCLGTTRTCANGWIEGPSSCYRFVMDRKVPWKTAQGLCRDMGGVLTTLDNHIEIMWLRGYRGYHPNLREAVWIGGYRKSKNWLWKGRIADKAITLTDWAPKEPNNDDGDEKCIMLYGYNSKIDIKDAYRWNDKECDFKLPFICERDYEF